MKSGNQRNPGVRPELINTLKRSYGSRDYEEYEYFDTMGYRHQVELNRTPGTRYWSWQLDARTGAEMLQNKRAAINSMISTLGANLLK